MAIIAIIAIAYSNGDYGDSDGQVRQESSAPFDTLMGWSAQGPIVPGA